MVPRQAVANSSIAAIKIQTVDFFYLSMPQVLDIGDGSQDMLLVRVIDSAGHRGRRAMIIPPCRPAAVAMSA